MTPKEFEERTLEILVEESVNPEGWWYLSFAGDTFKGAAIVRGRGIVSARIEALTYGIIPDDCEVLGVSLDGIAEVDSKYWNRLLTKDELDLAFADSGGVCNLEGERV